MNRLEETRKIVDEILLNINDTVERRCGYVHLYGVSKFAAMLALRRGLDPEISAICGMFHDIYTYRTGIIQFHDQNGAEDVRPIIRDMGIFSEDEQVIILSAIFHHSDKKNIHKPYDELLKDADVLQHYLYNTDMPVRKKEADRLEAILKELALPYDFEIIEDERPKKKDIATEDKRTKLANIAQMLVSKVIEGLPEDEDYRIICRYWPDKDIHNVVKGSWCACFVYHCCIEAGFVLPIRHPLVSHRFAGVGAWLQWARLSETGFFHSVDDSSFIPERGDIVIYEKLLTNDPHDHIGVVLSCEDGKIIAAEGNMDNKNKAGIVNRSSRENVAGFIRIDNGFEYEHTGRKYDPKYLVK